MTRMRRRRTRSAGSRPLARSPTPPVNCLSRNRAGVNIPDVVIAAMEQCIHDGREDARLVAAEVIVANQIQGVAGFRVVVVVPERIVPAPGLLHLFGSQAEQEKLSSPAALAISIVAPSRVPTVSAPFIMNFMLPMPLASNQTNSLRC